MKTYNSVLFTVVLVIANSLSFYYVIKSIQDADPERVVAVLREFK
jgi:hypothetical protein